MGNDLENRHKESRHRYEDSLESEAIALRLQTIVDNGSEPKKGYFVNRDVLLAQSPLRLDKLEGRYHSQYRSQSQSNTNRFLWCFCQGLHEYRQPDRLQRNLLRLHKY